MLNSSFLDVAIGIVFVFLLLSLIASTINEIILSFLNMRGRTLLEGIKTLLNDPKAEGLVKEIYNHGQVYGLFKGEFNPGKSWKQAIPFFRTTTDLGKCTRSNLPSYIPTTNFVMAFLGVLVGPKRACEVADKQAADARANADKAKADAAAHPADNDKQDVAAKAEVAAEAAKKIADRAKTEAEAAAKVVADRAKTEGDAPQSTLEKLAAAFTTLSPGKTTADTTATGLAVAFQSLKTAAEALRIGRDTAKVGKPLYAMVVAADNDFDKLKTSIEDWYNSAMDRASGWYKYQTQTMLFFIGLVLAIALNADTVNIVQQLSRNPTLRESIVAAAQSAVAEKKSAQANNPPQVSSPAAGNNPAPGNNPAQGNTPDVAKQLKDVSDQIKEVEGLGIPLGWPPPKALQPNEQVGWFCRVWQQATPVLEKPTTYFGWLLTAVAVSLGAPFWFDMLNKIMIVRSTVKPGEKSQPAPAKDKEKK